MKLNKIYFAQEIKKHFKIFLLNILVLLISLLIYKNYIDTNNYYTVVPISYQISESKIDSIQDTIHYKKSSNPKNKISNSLAAYSSYEIYFDRNCVISGSLEERKRVRWTIRWVEYKLYQLLFTVHKVLPYYANFFIYGILIWLGFFLCMQVSGYSWKNSCIYLFSIAFLFQHALSEANFSVIETMLVSLVILASYKKNLLLFVLAVILGVLNRESGILFVLVWFVFNKKDFMTPLYAGAISVLLLMLFNYDIIDCFFEPSFFLPTAKQVGQFNLSEVGKSISYLSFLRVIINNFLIPFGISIYLFSILENKKNPLFYIICLYYLMFIVATPLHHLSVKMITIPLIVLLSNLDKVTVNER